MFLQKNETFLWNVSREDTIDSGQRADDYIKDDDIDNDDDVKDDDVNDRPIVAVLSMGIDSEDDLVQYQSQNYTSYIAASYVKYMEMAGARAVPVLLNQPDEYYIRVFKGTNGMLIPGGNADIHNSSEES